MSYSLFLFGRKIPALDFTVGCDGIEQGVFGNHILNSRLGKGKARDEKGNEFKHFRVYYLESKDKKN